ncbi:MAG: hypothetical protein D6800_04765, partial [Candidatus Zixiibacteriota bacterium]
IEGIGPLDTHHKDGWYFTTMGKLSSGVRINSAADDPAGLVISERLRSRIAELNGEIQNTTNNVFKYDYASAALGGLRSQLNSLRSLALAAANAGGNTETMQQTFEQSAQETVATYNQAVTDAEYNGARLFDGSAGALGTLPLVENIDLSSPEKAQDAIATIDEALQQVNSLDVQIGSTVKDRFQSELASLETERQNLLAADSVIRDTDYAVGISRLVRSRIAVQVSTALLAQGNLNGQLVLGLLDSK